MYIYVSLSVLCILLVCICILWFLFIQNRNKAEVLENGFMNATQAVLCVDLRGKCLDLNNKARELCPEDDVVRKEWIENYFKNCLERFQGQDLSNICWDDEMDVDGEKRFYHMEAEPVYDKKKILIGYCLLIDNRTDMKRQLEDSDYQATHDPLTGLLTRDSFFRKVSEIVQADPDTPRYMVCTNIRNFKLVNDLFGEEMGNRVLVDQAVMLKRANYPGTIHGRIIGDRYGMLIRKSDFNPELAAKNTSTLQYLINDSNHRLHILIGVYEITDPNESAKVMYDKANMAIEYCRDDYHDFVVKYSSDMMARLIYEKETISDFEQALLNREFRLYLQPQVRTDGSLKGAESLVRWEHAKKGLLQPKNFISLLEKAGLIIKLDQFIWEETCRKLADWKKMGREDLCLSVNISAKDFYYIDIYDTFTRLVEKYQINPRNLSLEITETVFISDVTSHLEVLDKLQNYGFLIGIDDFGSGYSSLNMLKDVTADILKIDMVFLQQTKNPGRRWVILDSVISMAKELGMSIVTEGVESREQFEHLTKLGSDIFQGFYFDEPLAEQDFDQKYLQKQA